MEATHSMDAAARRRRGGAKEDLRVRGRVGADTRGRTEQRLAEAGHATVDVTPDVVGVLGLHLGGPPRRAREDEIGEAGSESLDLALDRAGHVDIRAAGNVAVRP